MSKIIDLKSGFCAIDKLFKYFCDETQSLQKDTLLTYGR